MAASARMNFLGVLGGMGPLASAEFLKTIYEYSSGEREQQLPPVICYSDPTFPDRTEAILKGEDEILLARLVEALERLCKMEVTKIVICCMTIHYLLPKLPHNLRERIISLLDVMFAHAKGGRKKHLVLCSTGAREMRIFEDHPSWSAVKDRLIFPNRDDQKRVHEMIYEMKVSRGIHSGILFLESLLLKYQVDSFAAGCTEIHILAKRFLDSGMKRKYSCLDPLNIIARDCAEGHLWNQA